MASLSELFSGVYSVNATDKFLLGRLTKLKYMLIYQLSLKANMYVPVLSYSPLHKLKVTRACSEYPAKKEIMFKPSLSLVQIPQEVISYLSRHPIRSFNGTFANFLSLTNRTSNATKHG